VAEAVNDAASALVTAYQREQHSERLAALLALVGRVSPGDVAFTRAEAAAGACSKLLDGGGEAAPVLTRDLRQPRYGSTVAVDQEAAVYAPQQG
jgi:hypothetical protein